MDSMMGCMENSICGCPGPMASHRRRVHHPLKRTAHMKVSDSCHHGRAVGEDSSKAQAQMAQTALKAMMPHMPPAKLLKALANLLKAVAAAKLWKVSLALALKQSALPSAMLPF